MRNIERFIKIEGVNWLPSIQSRYLNRFSFFESCKRMKQLIGDYPRVAIGTVCKTNNIKFIEYCAKVARKFFPKSKIHAFGLTITALPKIHRVIDSWDSLAYSFIRGRRVDNKGRKKARCLNNKERVEFFYAYIDRINEILKEATRFETI